VTSVKHAKHLGCVSTSRTDEDVELVKILVIKNIRIMVHEVADILNLMWACSEHFERQSEYV
jgi:hypothetical protein